MQGRLTGLQGYLQTISMATANWPERSVCGWLEPPHRRIRHPEPPARSLRLRQRPWASAVRLAAARGRRGLVSMRHGARRYRFAFAETRLAVSPKREAMTRTGLEDSAGCLDGRAWQRSGRAVVSLAVSFTNLTRILSKELRKALRPSGERLRYYITGTGASWHQGNMRGSGDLRPGTHLRGEGYSRSGSWSRVSRSLIERAAPGVLWIRCCFSRVMTI